MVASGTGSSSSRSARETVCATVGRRVLSARTPALYAAAAALGMPMAVSVATLPDPEYRD